MGKVGKAEYVQRASRPTGMPSRSPTHDASALRCMMHFPSPPTHQKKKKKKKLDSSSKHHSLEAAYTGSARDGAVWRGYTGLYTRRDELSCIRNLGLTLATIRIVQTLCKPIFVRYKEPYNDIYRTLVHMHRWDIHLYTTLSRVCTQSIQQGGCDKIAVSDSDP